MGDKLIIDVTYPDDLTSEEIEPFRKELKRRMKVFSKMIEATREARLSEMTHDTRVAGPQGHPSTSRGRS